MDSDRDILLIAIFTFLTVSLWIFFELSKTSKIQSVTQYNEVLTQLDPTLDTETVHRIYQRREFK